MRPLPDPIVAEPPVAKPIAVYASIARPSTEAMREAELHARTARVIAAAQADASDGVAG